MNSDYKLFTMLMMHLITANADRSDLEYAVYKNINIDLDTIAHLEKKYKFKLEFELNKVTTDKPIRYTYTGKLLSNEESKYYEQLFNKIQY